MDRVNIGGGLGKVYTKDGLVILGLWDWGIILGFGVIVIVDPVIV